MSVQASQAALEAVGGMCSGGFTKSPTRYARVVESLFPLIAHERISSQHELPIYLY